jgi:shikimate kinase
LAGLRIGDGGAQADCIALMQRVRQPFNVNAVALAGAGTCTVVWLTARVSELARRTSGDPHRPALDDDAETVLARMESERRAMYTDLADFVVDTDGRHPAEVARRILDLVASEEVSGAG